MIKCFSDSKITYGGERVSSKMGKRRVKEDVKISICVNVWKMREYNWKYYMPGKRFRTCDRSGGIGLSGNK